MTKLQLLADGASAEASAFDRRPARATDAELLDAYSATVVGAVERVGPSVAHLEVWGPIGGRSRRQRGRGGDGRPAPTGRGAGVGFTPDGFMLTNPPALQQGTRNRPAFADGPIGQTATGAR